MFAITHCTHSVPVIATREESALCSIVSYVKKDIIVDYTEESTRYAKTTDTEYRIYTDLVSASAKSTQ
ncbi:MAG TPA: hypothetical protein V6D11_32745 [Waterburya sp.]|jgi:hypothetical protein